MDPWSPLGEELKRALADAEALDVAVGYFYFSGFKFLSNELRNLKIRIVIGKEIESSQIGLINTQIQRGIDAELDRFQPRTEPQSATLAQQRYSDSFIQLMNSSGLYDGPDSKEEIELFLSKLEDGSLEIRYAHHDHSKLYVLHTKNGANGKIFMGSSNFTYSGLKGQKELNEKFENAVKYDEYNQIFQDKWREAKDFPILDKHNVQQFMEKLKKEASIYAMPSPQAIYFRVLDELFSEKNKLEKVAGPSKISYGKYSDFAYQLDAIKLALDRLDKYDGAILADVVGLGKSIIAAGAAANRKDIRCVIIAPPHLKSQWDDYADDFNFSAKIYSSGSLDKVYSDYKDSYIPHLFIVDEAHNFRNQDNIAYQLLHKTIRSHPDNKVLLLTATPFSNQPDDIYALVKLFQTPGAATMRNVENLSYRFMTLMKQNKDLRQKMAKSSIAQPDIDQQKEKIALEQRRLIEPVIIRRSRLDLANIERYKKDLDQQGITFPEVIGPEELEYDLNGLLDVYLDTLEALTKKGEDGGFEGARYKPTAYIKDKAKFLDKYGDYLSDTDLKTAQTNLAKFMKRLLTMRFESSKAAFRKTLESIMQSYLNVIEWHDKQGKIPILKKGKIPGPEDYEDQDTGDVIENLDQTEKDVTKMVFIDIAELEPEYIERVHDDLAILQSLHNKWFGNKELDRLDPKLEYVLNKVKKLRADNPDRKIVIFSQYADTVEYVAHHMRDLGFERALDYIGSRSYSELKNVVKNNFDASIPEEKQADDYDVLVATDAISEGFNLHRAGVIINYDIPYNPTRVIQRVGRINRINKKVFDKIYIFNCFPTSIGDEIIKVKQIATLKIDMINLIVGGDTKILGENDEPASYFKDEFNRQATLNEEASWDAEYINEYDILKNDSSLRQSAAAIPFRARIMRTSQQQDAVIVFGKRGSHTIFTKSQVNEEAEIIGPEEALPLLRAEKTEKGNAVSDAYIKNFDDAHKRLFAKDTMPPIKGRRLDAINNLEALANSFGPARTYCNDLIKIIREYEDIADGTLKAIIDLDYTNLEDAYKEIQDIIPQHVISTIFERAERIATETEIVLLAEELKLEN